jgi:hypothetical protein
VARRDKLYHRDNVSLLWKMLGDDEGRLIRYWWRCPGLNGGPAAYESAALPTELHRHEAYCLPVVNRYELQRGSFAHSLSMKRSRLTRLG